MINIQFKLRLLSQALRQPLLNRLFLKENFHHFYRAAAEKSRNEKQP